MLITNTSSGPLDLPNGQTLKPSVPTSVAGWADLMRNPIVAAWVKERVLLVAEERPVLPVRPVADVHVVEGSAPDWRLNTRRGRKLLGQ